MLLLLWKLYGRQEKCCLQQAREDTDHSGTVGETPVHGYDQRLPSGRVSHLTEVHTEPAPGVKDPEKGATNKEPGAIWEMQLGNLLANMLAPDQWRNVANPGPGQEQVEFPHNPAAGTDHFSR